MSAFGAHYNVDSLQNLLKTVPEDTNKINDLNYLGRELSTQNPDTSILLCNQALDLSKKINFQRGAAGSYLRLGWLFYIQGNYPVAMDYYGKALKTGEDIESKMVISFSDALIGQVYESENDNQKALEYYSKSLKMDEEMKNKWGVARTLGLIGVVYVNEEKYSTAMDYYFKALKMSEELKNKNGVAVWLSNIGSLYKDSSVALMEKDQAKGDSLLGVSMDYSLRALKIFQELDNKWSTAETLMDIGGAYSEEKKFNESYDYLYRGLALSQSIGGMDDVKSCYEMLSTLYEKSDIPLPDTIGGKLLSMEEMRLRSLYYHKRFISIRDIIFSQDRQKQILNFEFEKKQAVAKAEADASKNKQDIIIRSVISGLLLTLIFAGFIFRSLRLTRKQKLVIENKNKETEAQKTIIERKQKEILDSIQYAKRIQESLLPTEKYIDRTLKRFQKKEQKD